MEIAFDPMPEKAPKVRERIDVRLRSDQKMCIEKAASIRGVSVTEFTIQNAIENAMQTIRSMRLGHWSGAMRNSFSRPS